MFARINRMDRRPRRSVKTKKSISNKRRTPFCNGPLICHANMDARSLQFVRIYVRSNNNLNSQINSNLTNFNNLRVHLYMFQGCPTSSRRQPRFYFFFLTLERSITPSGRLSRYLSMIPVPIATHFVGSFATRVRISITSAISLSRP